MESRPRSAKSKGLRGDLRSGDGDPERGEPPGGVGGGIIVMATCFPSEKRSLTLPACSFWAQPRTVHAGMRARSFKGVFCSRYAQHRIILIVMLVFVVGLHWFKLGIYRFSVCRRYANSWRLAYSLLRHTPVLPVICSKWYISS